MSDASAGSALLRGLLTPLSLVYAGVVGARNLYYEHVRSASRGAGVPVVSVGNLTVGGTGKTPLAIEIVRRLRALGHRPAVLTRGYAAASGQEADEVLEYRLAAPEVPVVVNADRVAGAATARLEHGADCVVLDDGFQHRRLRRDLDIVLVDALSPWGGGWLLPAGRLREPLASLRRANWVVLTRCNQIEPRVAQEVAATVQRFAPRAAIIKAAVECDRLVDLAGQARAVEELAGRRVLPVCGIGNPRTFLQLVARLTECAVEPLVFADHQRYTAADVATVARAAQQRGASWVVTTRKDWVKLSALWSTLPQAGGGLELLCLEAHTVLADPRGEFDRALRRLFEDSA